MLVYRFFYASEVIFRQAFAIVTWIFFAVGLVTTPLLLLVLQLKGDWNINPQEAIQANLGLLLDKSTAAKPLWALLSSIDVFSLWMIFLLAVGFGVASRKTTGSAIWGVAVPVGDHRPHQGGLGRDLLGGRRGPLAGRAATPGRVARGPPAAV